MLILENKSRNVKIFREFQLQGQAQESFRGIFDRGKKRVEKKQKKGRLFRFVRNLVVERLSVNGLQRKVTGMIRHRIARILIIPGQKK